MSSPTAVLRSGTIAGFGPATPLAAWQPRGSPPMSLGRSRILNAVLGLCIPQIKPSTFSFPQSHTSLIPIDTTHTAIMSAPQATYALSQGHKAVSNWPKLSEYPGFEDLDSQDV